MPASVRHTSGLVSDLHLFPCLLSRPGFGLKLVGGAQHISVVLGSVFVRVFFFFLFTAVKVLFCALNKINNELEKKLSHFLPVLQIN